METLIKWGASGRGQNVDGVLILLLDQVLLTPAHLIQLAEVWESTGSPIVAAQYGEVVGTPAIFSHSLFDQLREIPSEAGARKLILSHEQLTKAIELPEAALDVDTPEDYQRASLLGK